MNIKQEFDEPDFFSGNISKNNSYKNSNNADVHEEQKHFQRIVDVFRSYKFFSFKRLFSSMKYIHSLPDRQRSLLNKYHSHLGKLKEAIEHNNKIIKMIIRSLSAELQNPELCGDIKNCSSVTQFDIDKLQSMLKQIYREWSIEAKDERDASFKPILNEIIFRFPPDKVSASDIQIFVPGAGLGRLPYEIAKLGYTCQGNEYSLFMLFTSNFILNKCRGVNLYSFYPWIHQYHNNLKACDQLEMVGFPDVNPFDIPPGLEFSMAAGNYVEVYKDEVSDKWDCIATCFFLDTGHNVIDYLETTWKILKPGGYWINLGPLLYHHSDVPGADSVEPSYEEIKDIIIELGFNMIKEKLNVWTPYSNNPRSMMTYEYKSVFFVCQKPDSSNGSVGPVNGSVDSVNGSVDVTKD